MIPPSVELVNIKQYSGKLPETCLVAAVGLLITVLSYVSERSGQSWAMLVFWTGVLLIFIPVVVRLWDTRITRSEAIILLLVIGELFYLVSLLRDPFYFTSFDELIHWRTADDIIRTHHLFTSNSLLIVSPLYPGLEIVTNALANLCGLSIFHAGVIVVAISRLILVLALYLIFENLSGSVRAAGLGTAIYMGSSTFFFFDTQFAYESLAVPLVLCVLFLILKRSQSSQNQRMIWSSLAFLTLFSLVIVHHTSSIILGIFLLTWTFTAIFMNRRGKQEYIPYWMAVALICWMLFWLFSVARPTIDYLSPHINDVFSNILQYFKGRTGNRAILQVEQGGSLYERFIALTSVAFILLGLFIGFRHLLTNRKNLTALSITFALTACMYPLIPILRLNSNTWEISNRLASFIFIGVGFIIGLGLVGPIIYQKLERVRPWLVFSGFGLILMGGIIAGSNPSSRLPGPYVVEADNRSIDPLGLTAASWARQILGMNNRMASDRVQSSLMGSYGGQRMVFRHSDGVDISGIFLTNQLGKNELSSIKNGQIKYLVIDRRITSGLPLYGYYYENWEKSVVQFEPPVRPIMLEKFDVIPGVSRLYDNGSIVIYDIGGLLRDP